MRLGPDPRPPTCSTEAKAYCRLRQVGRLPADEDLPLDRAGGEIETEERSITTGMRVPVNASQRALRPAATHPG